MHLLTCVPSVWPSNVQVLLWSDDVCSQNAVARSLHSLFRALQQAEQQQAAAAGGSAASGGAPVAVDPSELREALAALPNELFRLGAWQRHCQGAAKHRLQIPLLPCCLKISPPAAANSPPTCFLFDFALLAAEEMSDAGETLLSIYDQIKEASTLTAGILDLVLGLRVSEAVICSSYHKITHNHAYTQYFYNTRVSGGCGVEGSVSSQHLPRQAAGKQQAHSMWHFSAFLFIHARWPRLSVSSCRRPRCGGSRLQ